MSESDRSHRPVLHMDAEEGSAPSKDSVLGILKPNAGDTVLDVTLGLGGHSKAFLRAIGPRGHLFALDADAENLRLAKERLAAFGSQCTFFHENFRYLPTLSLPALDVIFADLGVSSPHLDDPSRGFTFRHDAPLDLRYDQSSGKSAAEYLANASEQEIFMMLRNYGELRESKHLAAVLYRKVRKEGIQTTTDVKECVEGAVGYRSNALLPQVFQALRIQVNDELGALEQLLSSAPPLLRAGGRMGIISYHSLEDRLVKRAFRSLSLPVKDPTTGAVQIEAPFTLLTSKAVVPSPEEIQENPRSRSARFRAIMRKSTEA